MHHSLTRCREARKPSLIAAAALILVTLTLVIASCADRAAGRSTVVLHKPPPLLFIDAGHGGLDGGAVTADGHKESEINLAVAQRVCDLCRFLGLNCVMTRTQEQLDYPPDTESIRAKKTWDLRRRAEAVNGADGAVLLSIHQNRYPDSRPSGTQVIYAPTPGSPEFAALTHENLRFLLCPLSRRVPIPAGKDIYLLNNVNCPAILVECGFLSNPEEAQKLLSPGYQTEIAAILCASYLQYLNPVF